MLIDTARLLLRRWRYVVLTLVLAVGASVAAVFVTPPSYESRAQVLFLPPPIQPGIEGKVNPFLAFGAALGVTADIVRLDVSDDATRAELVDQGALEEYEVEPYLADNGGPILNVMAQGPDSDQTRRTVSLVVERIIADLRSIQASAMAPSGSYITASLLTETPAAERSVTNQVRAAAVVGPTVLVLFAAFIVLADRLAARRRRRVLDDVPHGEREREALPDEQLSPVALGPEGEEAGDRGPAGKVKAVAGRSR